jgi:hypothetical protein
MKFTKPISREVEISGNTVIVTLDEGGASFRLKGKRRSTRIDWATVLRSSVGEDGEPALEYLGLPKEVLVTEPLTEEAEEAVMSASATSIAES